MKAKSEHRMRHELPEVQEIIDYEFLNQNLDNYVKLDILFYELDRLEKTVEMRGSPYVFLDPEEAEITVHEGRKRFEKYLGWITEKVSECKDNLPVPDDDGRLDDLYNSLIDVLWREDIEAMVVLTLAQIVIVQGLETYSGVDT